MGFWWEINQKPPISLDIHSTSAKIRCRLKYALTFSWIGSWHKEEKLLANDG